MERGLADIQLSREELTCVEELDVSCYMYTNMIHIDEEVEAELMCIIHDHRKHYVALRLEGYEFTKVDNFKIGHETRLADNICKELMMRPGLIYILSMKDSSKYAIVPCELIMGDIVVDSYLFGIHVDRDEDYTKELYKDVQLKDVNDSEVIRELGNVEGLPVRIKLPEEVQAEAHIFLGDNNTHTLALRIEANEIVAGTMLADDYDIGDCGEYPLVIKHKGEKCIANYILVPCRECNGEIESRLESVKIE